MKNLITIITLLVSFVAAKSQNEYYNQLEFGRFQAGYMDTVLYNPNTNYNQFKYRGPAPIFIKVWHPIKANSSSDYLNISDFKSQNLPINLQRVSNALNRKYEEQFVSFNLSEDYLHFETIDYSPKTANDLLKAILKTSTKSVRSPLDSTSNFPIVIYHHGSRGIGYDNYVMAEFLASHGYIVVSANYNWPYPNFPYGFSPTSAYELASPKIVIEFAKSLTSNKKTGFVGHSWGAQTGLSFLHETNWADAFVSMETTLELWDSSKVSRRWPFLYSIINKKASKYQIPMLFFANQGDSAEVDYKIFRKFKNSPLIFCSSFKEFGHESYSSLYTARFLHSNSFPQLDSAGLKEQIRIYSKTLSMTKVFLDDNLKGIESDYSPFESQFFIDIPEFKEPVVVSKSSHDNTTH